MADTDIMRKIIAGVRAAGKERRRRMGHELEPDMIQHWRERLAEEEKSRATIQKYTHDLKVFYEYVEDREVDKERVIGYKQYLEHRYAASSVNSMLVALNRFLKEMGWYECVVKLLKIQKKSFRDSGRDLSRKEYQKLLMAAKEGKKVRLYYLMQALCATGIRVSELPFITAEAVWRGSARVTLKGKVRTVLLPTRLQKILKEYMKICGIQKGSLFLTKSGRTVNRSDIWREMKALCEKAGVDRQKVFPHNLRHLFACTFYKKEKNLATLADVLGHSSVDTTRIYTMVSGEEQARLLSRLGLVL